MNFTQEYSIILTDNQNHYMPISYNSEYFYLFNLQSNSILKVQADWLEKRNIQPSKEYQFLNKYVNPQKIEIQENIFNVPCLEHQYIEDCGNPDCGICPLCTLSICKVCGGSEGSLTTECSGENNYQKDEDVYSGEVDFRYGKWRNGICTRYMLWSPDKAIPNEVKFLQELLSEGALPKFLEEECNYIAKWITIEKGLIQ